MTVEERCMRGGGGKMPALTPAVLPGFLFEVYATHSAG